MPARLPSVSALTGALLLHASVHRITYARAVLAVYKTAGAVPAAAGVEPRDAQRVRAMLAT